MATKAGTRELIARELGSVLAPLEQRLQGGGAEELVAAVGVRVPASVAGAAPGAGARNSAVTRASALGTALTNAPAAAPLTPAEKTALQAALQGIHRKLFDFIIIEYIESKSV